jgi:hypothetical protein
MRKGVIAHGLKLTVISDFLQAIVVRLFPSAASIRRRATEWAALRRPEADDIDHMIEAENADVDHRPEDVAGVPRHAMQVVEVVRLFIDDEKAPRGNEIRSASDMETLTRDGVSDTPLPDQLEGAALWRNDDRTDRRDHFFRNIDRVRRRFIR